jgi:predicted metal-binding protein
LEAGEFARGLGIENCLEFSPDILVPEESVRGFCKENKCGNYGNNYMCPPYIGSLDEIKVKLREFKHGLLLQYSKDIDVKGNREGVLRTKKDFHNMVLQIEEFLRARGINQVWGMMGGNCDLCDVCKAKSSGPCAQPDKARTSLEAIGIDVLGLLDKFGLDNEFHTDKIIWTGCILYAWRVPQADLSSARSQSKPDSTA